MEQEVKEKSSPHPLSKEGRALREKKKQQEMVTEAEEKTFEEAYGIPEIDPSKEYEFEFIKKSKSPSMWITGTCKIYDHVEKRQRVIRYNPTEDSIFEDEQEEPLQGESRYYTDIYFPHGKKVVKGTDKNLILFLYLTDDFNGKSNRLKRLPAIIKRIDKAEDAKKSLAHDSLLREAIGLVQDSELKELLPFAAMRGIDISSPKDREFEIRNELMRWVRKNPAKFKQSFGDPKHLRRFEVYEGFQKNIITSTHVKNQVHWVDSLVKVVDVPPGEVAIDYVTDWSFSKQGEDFLSALRRLSK